MTISNQTVKATVLGNGAQTVFTYQFEIPVNSGFELIYTDSSGNETMLATSVYSISGIGNPAGGTFTYNPGGTPIASGTSLTLVRQVPYDQLTNFGNQTSYNPEVLDAALDWIVMQTQQLQEWLSRCLYMPVVEGATAPLPGQTARANMYLGFDNNGLPIVLPGTAGGVFPNSQDFYVFSAGLPSTSQKFTQLVFNRAIAFPANFAGSHAICDTVPTANVVVNILYNGVQVGQIAFAEGATTGTITSTGAFTTAAGGVMLMQFQSATDATFADFSATLAASSAT